MKLVATASLAVSFFLLLNPSRISACQSAASKEGDELRHNYIDDDDQRPLADLKFELTDHGRQGLTLIISATGSAVQPIAGYPGISGSNRYTAEELELMLQGVHDVEIRTRDLHGLERQGSISAGSIGDLPTRRFVPGQPIDFLARTSRQYPLSVRIHAHNSQSGEYHTELLLNGVPRLRTRYAIHDGQLTVLDVNSVGHDDQLLTDIHWIRPGAGGRLPISQQHRLVARQETPQLPSELLSDWNERDLEGRWVLMQQDLHARPDAIDAWVNHLTKTESFALMEWLAIYVPDAFKSQTVGTQLAASNAPQWLRVAVWHQNAPLTFGHSRQVSTEIILYHEPGVAEDWLKVHQNEIDNWTNRVSAAYEQLAADETPPKDSSHLLPPLQPTDVFAFLSAPEHVVDFGDRRKATPNTVYVHQVLRAIDGVVVSGRHESSVLEAVRKLIHHENPQIRQSALMAFTWLAPRYPQTERFADLLQIVNDDKEPSVLREAALMGYSYQDHPAILLTLHDIAESPPHPAWSAAVSRLGDFGESFSAELLQSLDASQLNAKQSAILADTLDRIAQRSTQPATVSTVVYRLRLAAFALQTHHRHAQRITDWAVASGKAMENPEREQLKTLDVFGWGPFWTPNGDDAFRQEVRQIAVAGHRNGKMTSAG